MYLNLLEMFGESAVARQGDAQLDFTDRDFGHFAVAGPVSFGWKAIPDRGLVLLDISLGAQVSADCARCLAPLVEDVRIQKQYEVRRQDLDEEFPELPIGRKGLDLTELAFGELVLETAPVLLCSEDCEGLCQQCGKPAAGCDCEKASAGQEGDPRLQVLRDLLQND